MSGVPHVEKQDVGFTWFDHEALQLGQSVGQQRGVGMVLREAVPVVVQRMEAGRCKDAGLPHCASHALLPAPRLIDERGGSGENGTHGTAEPLAQVDPGAVEAVRVLGG